MADVYALDFDGVICDSCGESSMSALKAAKIRWPGEFEAIPQAAAADVEQWILDNMRIVRPVVETGYENMLLVRLLLLMKLNNIPTSIAGGNLCVEDILSQWEALKVVAMEEWGETKEELVHAFAEVRDDWIDADLASWLAANRLYPGTADALRFATSPIYIVTTKQTRFALALLKELGGIDLPTEKIFGLGTGPKVQVLQMLQERPEHEGATFHFVEDRLATLKNVIKTPLLDRWQLYLGSWGYNTASEREEAAATPRIRVVDLSKFCANLK